MNFSKGLQRISAVWWSIVALGFGMLLYDGGRNPEYALMPVLAGIVYALHWLTCWVVKGFSGDGS